MKKRTPLLLSTLLALSAIAPREAPAQKLPPEFETALKALYSTFAQKALGMTYEQAKEKLKTAFEKVANFPAETKAFLTKKIEEIKTKGPAALADFIKKIPIDEVGKEIKRAFGGGKAGAREQSVLVCADAMKACAATAGPCKSAVQEAAKGGKLPELPEAPKTKDRKQVAAYEKQRAQVVTELGAICAKVSAKVQRALGEAMPRSADLSQMKQGAEGGVMGAFQTIASLPEKMKEKVKQLLWMPLESPSSTANDEKIAAFIREQLSELKAIRNFDVGGFKPAQLIPEADFNRMVQGAAEMVAGLATPVVRLFQFIRTKAKQGIKAIIWVAIQSFASAADMKAALKKKLEEVLHIPIPDIPPWVFTVAEQVVQVVAAAAGAFGTYLLNAKPDIKARVMSIMDGMANAADSLEEAMGAVAEAASAVGGDTAWADGEGAELVARAEGLAYCAKLPAAPTEDDKNRCGWTMLDGGSKAAFVLEQALLRAKKIAKPALDTPESRLLLRDLKIRVAEVRQLQAFGLKRERMSDSAGKLLSALRDAFVGFMTPVLQQVASLVNMAIEPVLKLISGVISTVISLIPYVGSAAAVVWGFVANLAIPVLLQIPPAIVIPVTLDVIGEEIKDLKQEFMQLWDDPAKRATIEKAQAALKDLFGPFKVVLEGIKSLRAGLSEGVGAVFRGPLLSMLLANLPYGLGTILQKGVTEALDEMFPANGKFNFNLMEVAGKVIDKVKDPIIDSVFEASGALGGRALGEPGAGRLKRFLAAVKPAAKAALEPVVKRFKETQSFASLFQLKVIRQAVGAGVDAAAEPLTDFVLGESYAAGLKVPCVNQPGESGFRDGLVRVVRQGIVPLITGDDNKSVVAIFQKGGFKALIPRVVQMAMERPAIAGQDAPFVSLMACVVSKALPNELRALWVTKWQRRFKDTLYDAASVIASEEKIDALMHGGLPALIGAALQVAGPVLAGLAADVLSDPPLEAELGAAIASLAGEVSSGEFVKRFTEKGIFGALATIACEKPEVKRALFGVLARKLVDPDLGTGLDESCKVLKEEMTPPKSLSLGSLKRLLFPAGRYAFKKAVQWGTLGAKVAAAKIKTYLLGVLGGMRSIDPTFDAVLQEFTQRVVPVLEKGEDAFFAKLATEARSCADKIDEKNARWASAMMSCLVGAGGAAVVAGTEASIRGAVEALATAVSDAAKNPAAAGNAFKTALSGAAGTLKGAIPELGALEPVLTGLGDGALGDLVAEAAVSFAPALRRRCAKVEGAPKKALAPFSVEVGQCVVEELVRLGVRGVARVAMRVGNAGVAAKAAAQVKEQIGAVIEMAKAVSPSFAGLVGDLPTQLGKIADVAAKSAAKKFAGELNAKCANTPNPRGLVEFAKAVGLCVVTSTKVAFLAGSVEAVRESVREVAKTATAAATATGEVLEQGAQRLKDQLGSLVELVKAVAPSLAAMVSDLPGTIAGVGTDAVKAAAAKFAKDLNEKCATKPEAGGLVPFTTEVGKCVATATKAAFLAGGEELVRSSVRALAQKALEAAKATKEAVSSAMKAVREQLGVVVDAVSRLSPGFASIVGDLPRQLERVGGAAVNAAAKKFAGDLTDKCAKTPNPRGLVEFAKAVGLCVVTSTKVAFLVGSVEAVRESVREVAKTATAAANATGEVLEQGAQRLKDQLGSLVELVKAVAPSLAAMVSDLPGTIAGVGTDAVKAAAAKFAKDLNEKCATKPEAGGLVPFTTEVGKCVATATKAAFLAGGEELVRSSVRALAQKALEAAKATRNAMGAAMKAVRTQLGVVVDAVSRLSPGFAGIVGDLPRQLERVGGAAVNAAAKKFAGDLTDKCAKTPNPRGLVEFAKAVGLCVVTSTKVAFLVGSVEAVRESVREVAKTATAAATATGEVLEQGAQRLKDQLGSLVELVKAVAPSLAAMVSDLPGTIAGVGTDAVKAAAAKFAKDLNEKCATKPEAGGLVPFTTEVGKCVATATKAAFLAGGEELVRSSVRALAQKALAAAKATRNAMGAAMKAVRTQLGVVVDAVSRLSPGFAGIVGDLPRQLEKVGGAAVNAAAKKFAGDLTDKCAKTPNPRGLVEFAKAVGLCVVTSTKGAFQTGRGAAPR